MPDLSETRYELAPSGMSGTIGATGTLERITGPYTQAERWEITRYATSSTYGSTLSIYKNYISTATFVDGTLKGQSDVGGIRITLGSGEKLVFYWSNGTPGDFVAGNVFGWRYVRGIRNYT